MDHDRRISDVQIRDLRARVDRLETDLRASIATTHERYSEMNRAIQAVHERLSAEFHQAHSDNLLRFSDVRASTDEVKATLKVMSASLDALLINHARIEGGTNVTRGVWMVLRSPFGKFWVWMIGIGWIASQLTYERLEMIRVWLFGSR